MLSFRCVVIIPQRTFNGPGAWVLVQSIARNTMGASSSSCADAKVKQCLQKCMPGLEAWSGRPEHSIHEVLQLTCHHKACASYPIIACAGRVQIPRTYRTKNDWFKIFEDCVDEILVEWMTSNDSLSKQWKVNHISDISWRTKQSNRMIAFENFSSPWCQRTEQSNADNEAVVIRLSNTATKEPTKPCQ